MAAPNHEPEPNDIHPAPPVPENTGHPLFPRSEHETGPDRRRIDLIHIERIRDDGSWETCPKAFKASELRSWKDIVDLYGGGAYRARAQCAKTYQWQGTTERKEFAGPSRPFVEDPKRAAPVAAASQVPSPAYGPPPHPHGPTAGPHAPGYGPPGWTPPGWTPNNQHEPPPWVAMLIKALDRPAPAPQESALIGLMFKAMADQNALVFKMLAERQAPPPPAPAANPLELIRELKPLLDSNTAPGQFMQGVEIAKSLMQQNAPAAPPEDDFATTLAGIMRNLGGTGLLPGVPTAPAAPAAPPPPPPAAPPPAPTMGMDDLIRMIASNRDLTQRFLSELGRRASPPAPPAVRPAYEPPTASAAPASPPPPVGHGTPQGSPPASAHSPAVASAVAPSGRPEVAVPAAHSAPAPQQPNARPPAWPVDEPNVGTTVATSTPPDDDGPALELPLMDESDLRALLGSLFADGTEGDPGQAGPRSPDAAATPASPAQGPQTGPSRSVLLALTGRQKGQA